MLFIILLSISLSLDAFAVSAAHALKSTRIPFFSKLVITLISIMLFGCAMLLGGQVSTLFSPKVAKIIGINLMLLICVWMLIQVLLNKKKDNPPDKNIKSSKKSLKLPLKIIKNPLLSDIDNSQSISPIEAIFLD